MIRNFWPMYEDGAAIVGHDGTLVGGAVASSESPGGLIVGSLEFNGVDGAMNIGIVNLTAGTNWSVRGCVHCFSSGDAWIMGRNNFAAAFYASGTTFTVRIEATNYSFTIPSLGINPVDFLVTHSSGNDLRVYIDGTESSTSALNIGAKSAAMGFIGRCNASYHSGRLSYFQVANELLDPSELHDWRVATDGVLLEKPTYRQGVQRDQFNRGRVTVQGSCIRAGAHPPIMWRFGDDDAQVLIQSPEDGRFTKEIELPAHADARTFSIFHQGEEVGASTSTLVSCGDGFLVTPQSNGSGRADNNQVSSEVSESAQPAVYSKEMVWGTAADPMSGGTAIYSVLTDSSATGSFMIPFADLYRAQFGVAVFFIPCGDGGTTASQLLPPSTPQDTSTYYGAMSKMIDDAGGRVRGALVLQGESDLATATATYVSQWTTISNALWADHRCPTFAVKTHDTGGTMTLLWAAQDELPTVAPYYHRLADLSAITLSPDSLHFTTNAHITTLSGLLADGIAEAFVEAGLMYPLPGYDGYVEYELTPTSFADKQFVFGLPKLPASIVPYLDGSGNGIRYTDEYNRLLSHNDLFQPITIAGGAITGGSHLIRTDRGDEQTHLRVWFGDGDANSSANRIAAIPDDWVFCYPYGLNLADLTENNNDQTHSGSPTPGGVAGPIDGMKATTVVPGSNHRGQASAVIPAPTPITLLAVFKPRVVNINQYLISISKNDVNNNNTALWISSSGIPTMTGQNTTARNASSSVAISSGAWANLVGTSSGATARSIWVNGVNRGTNTGSAIPDNNNIISIGSLDGSTNLFFPDGDFSLVIGVERVWADDEIVDWNSMIDPADPTQSGYYGGGVIVLVSEVTGMGHSVGKSVGFSSVSQSGITGQADAAATLLL